MVASAGTQVACLKCGKEMSVDDLLRSDYGVCLECKKKEFPEEEEA